MSNIRRLLGRVAALFRSGRAEHDLAREISSHLQMLEDRFVSQGMGRDEARYAARREFGGVEQMKELQRDARSFRWLASWPMDLKLGARMLVKSPGLTAIAVLALAVAVGAGATYLEFINGLVHPALSFPGGERLIGIHRRDLVNARLERHTLGDMRIFRERLTLVEHVGASAGVHAEVIAPDGQGSRVEAVRITASAFRVMPTAPLAGRPLLETDEDPAAPPVAVIGEAFWRSRMQRDPAVLGRDLTVGNTRHTIVGIMPESFGFPVNHVLWIPLRDEARESWVTIFGRLKPGVSTDQAQAEVDAIVAAMPSRAGSQRADAQRSVVMPYVEGLEGDGLEGAGQPLVVFAVNLVFIGLLCVCAANVATLVFGRTVTREAEITVRAALGASRGRVISQLVAEALVLAGVAAVAGLGATKLMLQWVRPAWEQGNHSEMPFWWNERLDWQTFVYVAALSLVSALIIGVLPALKATSAEMQGRLKHAGAAMSMRFGRVWTSVVVFQVAFTVLFLLSVVAMALSFRGLIREFNDVAFERSHYLAASLEVTVGAERQPYIPSAAFLDALRRSPAIRSVTVTTRLPASDQEQTYFDIDGTPTPVRVAHIGPGFFETFERKVVAGRDFAVNELLSDANVAVVDESFVRFALGGRNPIGRQVRVSDPGASTAGPWLEIIGVTADMSTSGHKSLRDARVYRPIGALVGSDMYLVAHAAPGYRDEGLGAVAAAVREAARSAPPGRPVREVRTLAGGGDGDVIGYVFAALGIVGAVALLLATAGIYALVSFTLARRTREIGIRTALGASPSRIVTGLLSRAMIQVGIGVALGAMPGLLIVGSVAAEMGRNGLAEGAAAAAAVAAFVIGIAALSCSVPLVRALRVQPTDALRTN